MVPVSGELALDVRRDIIRAVELHMKATGLSQSDVAEAVGQSPTYVNNVLTESPSIPPATRDRILRDLNNWLEREARAREAQRPDDFVRTRVAERLIALAERLTERADMAIAFGPAGIGKTTTAQAIAAEIRTAVLVTAGYDTRTPKMLVNQLYLAVSRRGRPRGRITLESVIERLRMPSRVHTRNLVVIDQAHQLPDSAWSVLMELHDKAQCSILLVGTIDLRARSRTDDDEEFGQLSSRVGMRVNLAPELSGSLAPGAKSRTNCFTVTDIRRLFAHSKLKLHSDAARMLARIANTRRGTLRRVCRLFDWAEVAARQAGVDTITVEHIRAAGELVEEDFELPAVEPETGMAVAAG